MPVHRFSKLALGLLLTLLLAACGGAGDGGSSGAGNGGNEGGDNGGDDGDPGAPVEEPAAVITSGGALGAPLTPGPVDVDGDGTPDIEFVSFGLDSGFLDASASYGLVGNVGGDPGTGAAWVRGTSDVVAGDGVGRNEIIEPFRGALLEWDDNWSKVHLSSGDGWVQWECGATRDVVIPVVFVREGVGQDITAARAAALAYATAL